MSFLASRSTNAGCGVHTLLAASLGKGCTVRKASVLRTTYSLSFLDKVRTWQLEMFWDCCETSCTGESCSILRHPSNGRCWRLLIRRPTFPIAHSSRNTAYFPQLIVTQVVLCCCSWSKRRWLDWLDLSRWRWSLCPWDVDWALSWTITGYHN